MHKYLDVTIFQRSFLIGVDLIFYHFECASQQTNDMGIFEGNEDL